MPRAAPLQSNFNSGELSPLVGARATIDQYKAGLETCLNWLPLVQGPLTQRPGTTYVAPVKFSDKATRLQRFEFSTTQAYILEFGDFYMRVFRNNGQVQATGAAAYAGGTTYAVGNMATFGGLTYISLTAGNLGHQPDISPTFWTQQNAYEIATPYAAADVMALKFAQSADTLYIAHPSYAPIKITRTADNAWAYTTITFRDGPFLQSQPIVGDQLGTAAVMTLSGVTGNITITQAAGAPANYPINGNQGFLPSDVGRLFRGLSGLFWGYAVITGYVSPTVVNARVISIFNAVGQARWQLGLWNGYDGYPGAVSFFQDRLWWGGNTNFPQRLDSSQTGDYENMQAVQTDGSVTAVNAISVSLNADDVNVIRWLISDEKGLFVGSTGGEWVIRASTAGDAVTPTNITAVRTSTYGSANVAPVHVARAALFVQRSGRKLRELAYVFADDGFKAPDMTVLSEHITLGGMTQLAYQQEPQGIVWSTRGDGVLLAFTYNREQAVMGWSRHTIGGYSDAAQSIWAKAESVACIPASDGTRDELWLVVNRYTNGATRRGVEYMNKIWGNGDTLVAAPYLDGSLSYSGAPATVFGGLTHLVGQTVAALADGSPVTGLVVSPGATVTLPNAASNVRVGENYNADGKTLRPEAGAADGTAVGKTKRLNRVNFRLVDTVGLRFGPDSTAPRAINFRTTTPVGQPTPLFNGDKSDTIESDYDFNGQVFFRQDQPLPATIAAIAPQMVEQDRA